MTILITFGVIGIVCLVIGVGIVTAGMIGVSLMSREERWDD